MACLTQSQPAPWPAAASLYSSPLRSWNNPSPNKPRLRLPTTELPSRRFDPFADDDEPQNTPPQPTSRGRPLTISIQPPAHPVSRRRAPSFSAGTPRPSASLAALANASVSPASTLSSYTSYTSCPPPSASRVLAAQRITTQDLAPAPVVAQAPSPFHARHYPTADARCRLLARTLLNRIHAVGRPRSSVPSSLAPPRTQSCRGPGYVPSRLSECIVAA